jgi:hypothetical protein
MPKIEPISVKSLDPNKFRNIERLKEILKEAEPLHETMVRLTKEYGDAVERIKALAAALEGGSDGHRV